MQSASKPAGRAWRPAPVLRAGTLGGPELRTSPSTRPAIDRDLDGARRLRLRPSSRPSCRRGQLGAPPHTVSASAKPPKTAAGTRRATAKPPPSGGPSDRRTRNRAHPGARAARPRGSDGGAGPTLDGTVWARGRIDLPPLTPPAKRSPSWRSRTDRCGCEGARRKGLTAVPDFDLSSGRTPRCAGRTEGGDGRSRRRDRRLGAAAGGHRRRHDPGSDQACRRRLAAAGHDLRAQRRSVRAPGRTDGAGDAAAVWSHGRTRPGGTALAARSGAEPPLDTGPPHRSASPSRLSLSARCSLVADSSGTSWSFGDGLGERPTATHAYSAPAPTTSP